MLVKLYLPLLFMQCTLLTLLTAYDPILNAWISKHMHMCTYMPSHTNATTHAHVHAYSPTHSPSPSSSIMHLQTHTHTYTHNTYAHTEQKLLETGSGVVANDALCKIVHWHKLKGSVCQHSNTTRTHAHTHTHTHRRLSYLWHDPQQGWP